MKDNPYSDEQAIKEAYDSFIGKINSEKYHEAFDVLQKMPYLMIYISPLEAAMAHDEFRKFIGEKEASYFALLFVKEFCDALSGMDVTNLLTGMQEDHRLEGFLDGISKQHKKMLKDMGRE